MRSVKRAVGALPTARGKMSKTKNRCLDEITSSPRLGSNEFAEWQEALALAEDLADLARRIAMRNFRCRASPGPTKASDAASVEHEIDVALRAFVADSYPGHAIFDQNSRRKPCVPTWLIRSISGRASFSTGSPMFGTLIALIQENRPLFGVIDMPALGERWTGTHKDAHLNGSPVWTSSQTQLSDARVTTALRGSSVVLDRQVYNRRAVKGWLDGNCQVYGLLASGHCDLVIEDGLRPEDFMPLVCIVEGAGGSITDWQGRALGLLSDGRVVAAATRQLHQEAIRTLKKTGERPSRKTR